MYHLHHVKPRPIFSTPLPYESDIWNRDLTLDEQRRYLVSAPSGRGKSTFVHILYGLRSDYEGLVTYRGKPVLDTDDDTRADWRQRQQSIVFQDLRLFPHLTGLQNLQVKMQLTQAPDEMRIRDYCSRLGIAGLLDQSAGTMSYGQQQRFAIVRALLQPFEILLLDEPFSHLDADNTEAAGALIEEVVSDQEAAMILVSLGDRYGMEFDEELVL